MTAEEVYVFTRLAGDKVGATKMDRPEDVEPTPRTGRVYVALTNNTDRGKAGKAGADEANPRNANKHGQILELAENGDDPAGDGFAWRLFLVARRPGRPGHVLRGLPEGQGQPDLLPGQRRLRPARQPVDLHRRQPARLARRPVRRRDAGRAAR